MTTFIRGIAVADGDAVGLADSLWARGRAVDIEVAVLIESSLETGVPIAALGRDQADAVLSVLVDPPPALTLLRGALLRERYRRAN